MQVSRLRRKIDASDDGEGFIKTVRGAGYMFVPAVVRAMSWLGDTIAGRTIMVLVLGLGSILALAQYLYQSGIEREITASNTDSVVERLIVLADSIASLDPGQAGRRGASPVGWPARAALGTRAARDGGRPPRSDGPAASRSSACLVVQYGRARPGHRNQPDRGSTRTRPARAAMMTTRR